MPRPGGMEEGRVKGAQEEGEYSTEGDVWPCSGSSCYLVCKLS